MNNLFTDIRIKMAILKWSQARLSKECGVSTTGLSAIFNDGNWRVATMLKILEALDMEDWINAFKVTQ